MKVALIMPLSLSDQSDPSEEARVLFVGATRASEELRTVRPFTPLKFHPLSGERRWRSTSLFQEVEIGLDGDILPLEAVEVDVMEEKNSGGCTESTESSGLSDLVPSRQSASLRASRESASVRKEK